MATQITPSKQVCDHLYDPTFTTNSSINADLWFTQAASGLDNLKMADSPLKKINYEAIGKENLQASPLVDDMDLKKPSFDLVKEDVKKPVVAPTIKPEEAHEPLLQENPQRFVLFPIRYHEVRISHASRIKWVYLIPANLLYHDRSGACTRKQKPRSGPPKKSTSPKISTTGTTA